MRFTAGEGMLRRGFSRCMSAGRLERSQGDLEPMATLPFYNVNLRIEPWLLMPEPASERQQTTWAARFRTLKVSFRSNYTGQVFSGT